MWPFKKKNNKIEAISKQILIWYKVCMIGVDMDLLKEPRPTVGAILFFIGSIDNLCQSGNVDDKDFAKLAIELLGIMGFQKDFTIPILKNFYTQQVKSEFALKANLEGGKKISEFLSGKNEFASLAFEAFVREWAEKPDLIAKERFLNSEGVPFVFDESSRKLFRLEGDKRVFIEPSPRASDILLTSTTISEERALELAE